MNHGATRVARCTELKRSSRSINASFEHVGDVCPREARSRSVTLREQVRGPMQEGWPPRPGAVSTVVRAAAKPRDDQPENWELKYLYDGGCTVLLSSSCSSRRRATRRSGECVKRRRARIGRRGSPCRRLFSFRCPRAPGFRPRWSSGPFVSRTDGYDTPTITSPFVVPSRSLRSDARPSAAPGQETRKQKDPRS